MGAQVAVGLHAHPMAAGAAMGDGDVGPRPVGDEGRSTRTGALLARLLRGGERRGAPKETDVGYRSVVELVEWALHGGKHTNASKSFSYLIRVRTVQIREIPALPHPPVAQCPSSLVHNPVRSDQRLTERRGMRLVLGDAIGNPARQFAA